MVPESDLFFESARTRVAELKREIAEHDRRYYEDNRPTITDARYDQLLRELAQLEREYPSLLDPESPTRRVSGKPQAGFRRVQHRVPMRSLDNLYEKDGFDGLSRWCEAVRKLLPQGITPDWLVEPKIDGVAVSVRYENGELKVGATRGDGEWGDDITANLRTIEGIPQRLSTDVPPVLELRGEVYMPTEGFRLVSSQMKSRGEQPFANPRNAAAGSLKLLDPDEVRRRPLAVVFYGMGEWVGAAPSTQLELIDWLRIHGLPAPCFTRLCVQAAEVFEAIGELAEIRSSFGFETDGAVVKLNSFSLRHDSEVAAINRSSGANARFPVWAKAWKYYSEQAETKVRGITIQVGRTGVLTPVAELLPVILRGSTISRATLHNEDEIRTKDIRIDDTVLVEKAGEVIPAVIGVVLEKRPPGTTPFDFGAHINGKCPVCGAPVRRDPQFKVWLCENLNCPAQKTRRLVYFGSRAALDLEGLGESVADRLVVAGLVDEPIDVFDLKLDQLRSLRLEARSIGRGGKSVEPEFGEKNASKLLSAIERARRMPLHRWLHALAIPEVGEETAYVISQHHRTLAEIGDSSKLRNVVRLADLRDAALRNSPFSALNSEKDRTEKLRLRAEYDRLNETADQVGQELLEAGFAKQSSAANSRPRDVVTPVGPVAARSILEWFASASGRRVTQRLTQLGINPTSIQEPDGAGPLAGKIFVLTGTLPTLQRGQAEAEIRKRGGIVSGSVSKKTSYVVAGAEAGSKLDKAQALGVAVIDEAAFLQMLAGG